MTDALVAGLTPRTDRQILAARIRAARITKTFRHYYKPTKNLDANCWTISVQRYVELDSKCQCTDCKQPVVKRIALNFWGRLYEIDVCKDHEWLHGKWVERF